jgi:hypothetical protein
MTGGGFRRYLHACTRVRRRERVTQVERVERVEQVEFVEEGGP